MKTLKPYRGYSLSKKKWIYGYYVKIKKHAYIIPTTFDPNRNKFEDYEVDPYKVCKGSPFMIETQKNRQIFDGDRVSLTIQESHPTKDWLDVPTHEEGYVDYFEGQWVIFIDDYKHAFTITSYKRTLKKEKLAKDLKVIGTIYDKEFE